MGERIKVMKVEIGISSVSKRTMVTLNDGKPSW